MKRILRKLSFSTLAAILILSVLSHAAVAETLAQTRRRELSRAEIWKIKRTLAQAQGIPFSELRNYELDHIVPLAAGGTNQISNLQLLTKSAHKEKTKRDIHELALQRKHYKPVKVGNLIEEFKRTKPSHYHVRSAPTHSNGGSSKYSDNSRPKTVKVKGYYRKDGTYVRPHTRKAPRKK